MAKLKISVHPLFIIFGIYFAVLGKVFSFIVFTVSAVVHEMGHSLVAESRGYRLKKIVLMPYGAVVSGDNRDMTYKDQVAISLAGPLVSLFIAIIFVCLWWIIPEIYYFTDLLVVANLTIATINLLPFYPLDGGRILMATLSIYFGGKRGGKIAKIIAIIGAFIIFLLFGYSVIIKKANFSILFFSLFILFGNIFVSKEGIYLRSACFFSLGDLKKGKKVNKIAINQDTTIRMVLPHFVYGELLECDIYCNGRLSLKIAPDQVLDMLTYGNLDGKVILEYKKLKKSGNFRQ